MGADPDLGWGTLRSSPPFAYLHLTNTWKCFPRPCWSKASRLFWLRANGAWDRRLDALGLTPFGTPFSPGTRVLTLPPSAWEAIAALAPLPLNRDRPAAKRVFRQLHALVHNLVTVAALVGRRAAVPEIPCAFIRAIQPLRNPNLPKSRYGLAHPAFIITGAQRATCYLAPATWHAHQGAQCTQTEIMHPFDLQEVRPLTQTLRAARVPPP